MSPTVMIVLLPVDEVVGRLDPQRVGLDGRA
jgi:hypothetical protein